MNKTLWTKNFTLVTAATALGSIGAIAGGFALSFLVFDETGSTLASAVIVAVQLVPLFVIPLVFAPVMDRLPRKPMLVWGDVFNCVLYGLAGLYLLKFRFNYTVYLVFSLFLASLGAFDELAYDSIYPKLIPEGMEEKGYTVSSMLYPVMKVIMTPLAAVLLDVIGVAWLLIIQSAFSLLAALTENHIDLKEDAPAQVQSFSLTLWWKDVREAAEYLKRERGLRSIYGYMAVTNGVASGYAPLLIACFRTLPGLTAAMYSLFSAAEFIGRSIGGLVQYRIRLDAKKKFGFIFFVYQFYEVMDMSLLWLPYPLMLVNRALAGFLGINSATMRQAAVSRHIPETLRSRINAFGSMCITASALIFSLLLGALGEIMDYRLCITAAAAFSLVSCYLTVWRCRKDVRAVYNT